MFIVKDLQKEDMLLPYQQLIDEHSSLVLDIELLMSEFKSLPEKSDEKIYLTKVILSLRERILVLQEAILEHIADDLQRLKS